MYLIEMHYNTRASCRIVLEKGDHNKSYDDLSKFNVIINHSGDVDIPTCKWCKEARRVALKREREAKGA